MDITVNCIVAVDEQLGIGKNGTMPWPYLRNEMMYFQKMTSTPSVVGEKNVVIMGKRTWFSIPEKKRPLVNRINIILSRELREPPHGAHFLARTLDDAFNFYRQYKLKEQLNTVWVIGGKSVYESVLNYKCPLKLYITRIMESFDCDVFFPSINFTEYTMLSEIPGKDTNFEENGIKYKFQVYEKNFNK
ncbi:dihydrofolate reductase [Macaca mulatta rhadinovirus 17577]|uniref:Viral dihydrofolate reductase n=1 Tax=Macaca mulatta rhadinovirus 17577 TaxID=83534 RepID=Q9WRU3_9GAMA|nr:dihydrofolate reductase [Macacine gammaherpesvirus 5]AAD21331.1 dihydrofolate reductase [Macaca mulatta rhadinovirus 17577]WUF06298.1 dihydrofolate reductase [synthetic construct]WVG99605.1 dihydrofolate reductase [Macaca mulatta rhadinovirus]WSP06975.1 dihydrofolate reductase [Macacine gammaherpesvirus 5]WUF06377.1 dihydrofolate reductase [synthetic construct]